ncbi:LPD25 domain-containing protein [Eisenbergiella porci]|uniref:LPD25 domain-containing protein n=1 Tax=Eisenbergiella porci TaxID=2652274 RepID=UPI002A83AC3A|nr:LPD25 domain-containing protein [Eisenbergiella porci]
MSYSSYDHDSLETAETMKIERRIYFESEQSDLSGLAALPLSELLKQREESAAAEQEVFNRLKELAAAWEEQAGKTLALDKTLDYARTLPVKHTANQWEPQGDFLRVRSNAVYKMSYSITENTRYNSAAEKSIPYSWTLDWNLYTNAPGNYGQARIAGQKKVFDSREALDKYLNGRIKAHQHLFTEISPAILKEYADYFKVNGLLLPGYTIEGEAPSQAAELPQQITGAEKEQPEPSPAIQPPERREPVNEVFSILIDNRAEAQSGGPHGYWLSLPATAEQVQAAMKEIHISADNPQDFFIDGISAPEGRALELPEDLVRAASVDELNFLAAQLQKLDAVELAGLNAAMHSPEKFQSIGQIIDYAENTDCFILIDAKDNRTLGDYYLNRSGLMVVPDEWKPAIDTERLGQFIASEEKGTFTEYGYLLRTGDEWQRVHEGQPVPEEYRVMGYPAPEALREEAKAQPEQKQEAAAPPPQPVTPIILNSQNSADRMKEITDRLETGIQELFESERYKAYLTSMAKFHSYSFNNTLLIAMQGGQLVAGYNKWRDDFHRNVKKGEKAIKILAPAPFKAKKEVPKLDAQGKQVIGRDGKPVTEVQEVQVPAFKIVSVFDVSQTEGEPLPSLGVEELTGGVEQYQDFFKALEQTSPVPIGFEDIPGGSHGYYHLTEKRIAIQEGMSELQTVKTAIHEIAHSKLHAIDPEATPAEQAARPDSRTREVQAESVAYAVCQHYGLDTSDYSFGYVAGWSSGKDLQELRASLETIRATAHELITAIDGHLAELQQQRQAQQEQPEAAPIEQAAEQPNPDGVFSKLPPEQQQAMTDEVRAMLQMLIDTDLKITGEVSQGTKEAIQTQGFTLSKDGTLEKAEARQPQAWNRIDGILNGKPFMPEAFPNERANALIDLAEKDGQRLGNGERRLIVEYAEAVDDTQKVMALVNELCEQGYEMQYGEVDSFVKSRIEGEIAVANAERQITLDPAAEPIVTILWSESPHLKDGQQMPLHEADAVFKSLDEAQRHDREQPGYTGHWYDKTKFRIDFTMQGQPDNYEGRQDFGDGDGSLIEHIQGYHEYYAQDESWKNHVLHHEGPEAWEADKAQREMLLNEFIPYMKQHCNLSRMEQEAQRLLQSGDSLPPEQTAYLTALVDYVKECRPLLNQGEPLPEPPQLSDFDKSLQNYKEQVQAEVAQEAKAAGLTVEEYIASGSDAPAQPNFSIYQVPRGPEGRDFRYRSYEGLQADGLSVDRKNYQLVYTAPLDKNASLDEIYHCFNMEHPADYKGRSLSMGDIVVFRQDGKQTAYYVDRIGYREVPEFFKEQGRQLTPDKLETGETVKTPRGTFYVTAMSREQMEAAGYGFHHQSEDGRYLIMANGTRAFAIPAQQDSHIKTAEMSTEQNENMIDGILNNTPSMGELEARAKAGEQVSLSDVAAAVKAEGQTQKQAHKNAKANHSQKKPSIRAQLAAAKKEQKKNPPHREQSKELEV